MIDQTQIAVYESNSWLTQNLMYFEKYQMELLELDSKRDSIPSGFKPKEFLQFLRGSINHIKMMTAENKALKDALKASNLELKSEKHAV